MSLGILCGRVRVEEKAIFEACQRAGLDFARLNEDELELELKAEQPALGCELVLDRSLHHSRSLYTLTILEAAGIRTVNSARTAQLCGDKALTSATLAAAGIPMPKTVVTFSREAALSAIEAMGYPVVLKPVVGSWGRLLAKINDRDAAEAVLEHKETLGSYQHRVFYLQQYVAKPERDIRVLVLGGGVLGAMYRRADHWITNTARNGVALPCRMTPEIERLSLWAANAVGGEFVAVDLLEHPNGLLVNELNYTPEFRGFMEATAIDVAGHLVDYLRELMAPSEVRETELALA